MTEIVLEVKNLTKVFPQPRPFFDFVRRRPVQKLIAVDDVSLGIEKLSTLGLVGESGCGKTTLGRCILRLYDPTAGHIIFEGRDITDLNAKQMQDVRRKMQVIFQDPYSSLTPRMTVRQALTEALRFHGITPRDQEEEYLFSLLEMVGLNRDAADKYPRSFSGGQRQRIGLARALAVRPTLLIADEPVSALDVSIQAQILNLLADLRDELGLTVLFVAHELSVVQHVSDRMAVMYLGQVVEAGTTEEVFEEALHPYTEGLLLALPRPVPGKRSRKAAVEGDVPSPLNMPSGCRFHTRCPIAEAICELESPPMRQVSATHQVKCHLRPSRDWP